MFSFIPHIQYPYSLAFDLIDRLVHLSQESATHRVRINSSRPMQELVTSFIVVIIYSITFYTQTLKKSSSQGTHSPFTTSPQSQPSQPHSGVNDNTILTILTNSISQIIYKIKLTIRPFFIEFNAVSPSISQYPLPTLSGYAFLQSGYFELNSRQSPPSKLQISVL